VEAEVSTLGDIKAKQIDIIIDLTKTYFTWALGILGVVAFFLKGMIAGEVRLRTRELVLVELIAGIAIGSLLFGELVVSNIVRLLDIAQFSGGNPQIVWYSQFQFWSIFASLFFLTVLVHTFFWRRRHA
jgi:hypothetical protein